MVGDCCVTWRFQSFVFYLGTLKLSRNLLKAGDFRTVDTERRVDGRRQYLLMDTSDCLTVESIAILVHGEPLSSLYPTRLVVHGNVLY